MCRCFLARYLVLFIHNPAGRYTNPVRGLWLALLFVSFIPLLSVLFYIPRKKKRPRACAQPPSAKVSFILMAVSYPLGWLVLALTNAPRIYVAMAATYTFVTLGLIFFNLLLRYKASGHAAGVAGPVAAMIFLFGLWATPLLLLLPWSVGCASPRRAITFWQTVVGRASRLPSRLEHCWHLALSPSGEFSLTAGEGADWPDSQSAFLINGCASSF
jgi:hypothetical protein